MADHAEQVRGVLLFVLFGPDTANQLGWPDSSVEKVGFYFRGNVSSQADYLILSHTHLDFNWQLFEHFSPVLKSLSTAMSQ